MAKENKESIPEGYVMYEIPWDRNNKTPCKNVIINGYKYSVPIGKPVAVPKAVAEVLDQSMAQDRYAANVNREMQKPQITNF